MAGQMYDMNEIGDMLGKKQFTQASLLCEKYPSNAARASFDMMDSTILCEMVANNNVGAIEWLVDHGASFQGNDEIGVELLSVVHTGRMLQALERLGVSALTFPHYFPTRFLFEGLYECVEYLQKRGFLFEDIDVSLADIEKYKSAMQKYTHWKNIVIRTRIRAQRKIFFWVFPKIYRNPEFVEKQALLSYMTFF